MTTSVCPTSPSALPMHASSAAATASSSSSSSSSSAKTASGSALYSTSPTSPSLPAYRQPRRSVSGGLSASSSRRSPSLPRGHHHNGSAVAAGAGKIYIPPLHLPRGHDSSDVAALSSSLEDANDDALPPRNVRSAVETSLDQAVAAKGQLTPRLAPTTQYESTGHEAAVATMASPAPTQPHVAEDNEPMGPFEGPEKLLEVWFADALDDVADGGLMKVDRQVWEEMLDIVKCKVLSVIRGRDADAYLLSESSMFVFPHKLILKTCGTTTLLLGLERLLTVAYRALKPSGPHCSSAASLSQLALGKIAKRCFYSRKSFMFPERQKGPHRDWLLEVSLLDQFFDGGSAYTVGKMNGNHWLLYMTSPSVPASLSAETVPRPLRLPTLPRPGAPQDETLEILMTHLSPSSCARFEFPESLSTPKESNVTSLCKANEKDRGHLLGAQLCERLGLSQLFAHTKLDAFAFEPCGFSANALISRSEGVCDQGASETREGGSGSGKLIEDGYWTVHVTPEEDSSYASFETNAGSYGDGKGLPWLIARVLSIFEPARLSVTLFTSSASDSDDERVDEAAVGAGSIADEELDELISLSESKKRAPLSDALFSSNSHTATKIAPRQDPGDVLHALQLKNYRRTDRILYEFEDYDLVFVSFDKTGASLPRH